MNPKLFKAFQIEYKRHIEKIEKSLSEAMGGDSLSIEKIAESTKKLADASRILSISEVQSISKEILSLCNNLKDQDVSINKKPIMMIKDLVEKIKVVVSGIAEEKDLKQNKEHSNNIIEPQKGLSQKKVPPKILSIFQGESRDHLEQIRKVLNEIKTFKTIPEDRINGALRSAHSLKGAARAVDLQNVQHIAHRIESIFIALKNAQIQKEDSVVQIIISALDAIEDNIDGFFKGISSLEPSGVIEKMDKLLGVKTQKKEPLPKSESDRPDIILTEQPVNLKSIQYLKIDEKNMDRLQKTNTELFITSLQQKIVSEHIRDIEDQINMLCKENERLHQKYGKVLHQIESFPEYAGVVKFISLIGNDMMQISKKTRSLYRLQKAAGKKTDFLIQQMEMDLQHVRMVPVESMFQFFRKMVRDISADEGKSINFEVSGFDIQVDRIVLQCLKDPVMHLLRNAISHGIETKDERRKSGKSETGNVSLEIKMAGNRLKITVSDDGRGIAHQEIAQIAIKKKILTPDQAEKLSKEELIPLILKPGFSSSKMITDLSGRGMGLSIVEDAVNRLQGEIEIKTDIQKGTFITISAPLTILNLRIMVVRIKGQIFGIPLSGIDRLIKISQKDIQIVEGKRIIFDMEHHIPFAVPLAFFQEMIQNDITMLENQNVFYAVLIKSGKKKLALVVDELLEEMDVFVKDLPVPINSVPIFSGGFFLADGSVSLILNPKNIIGSYKGSAKGLSIKTDAPEDNLKPLNSILIVDDSITTRTLEKSILEAHGYNVCVAVDGVEGLKMLKEKEVDLVITDIDMPRMNGFVMIEEMKKDEKFKTLPVIIVTSLEDRKDKERGLNIGVDAYIVKQKFDQQNLLETIRQIL